MIRDKYLATAKIWTLIVKADIYKSLLRNRETNNTNAFIIAK